MYLYRIDPQDWHTGTMSFIDFMDYAEKDDPIAGDFREGVLELFVRTLSELARVDGSCWEGDIRSAENCRVFAVPGEITSIIGFILKQDNNGTTFVASQVELPHLLECGELLPTGG